MLTLNQIDRMTPDDIIYHLTVNYHDDPSGFTRDIKLLIDLSIIDVNTVYDISSRIPSCVPATILDMAISWVNIEAMSYLRSLGASTFSVNPGSLIEQFILILYTRTGETYDKLKILREFLREVRACGVEPNENDAFALMHTIIQTYSEDSLPANAEILWQAVRDIGIEESKAFCYKGYCDDYPEFRLNMLEYYFLVPTDTDYWSHEGMQNILDVTVRCGIKWDINRNIHNGDTLLHLMLKQLYSHAQGSFDEDHDEEHDVWDPYENRSEVSVEFYRKGVDLLLMSFNDIDLTIRGSEGKTIIEVAETCDIDIVELYAEQQQ